jgi:hypothetical protein
MSHKPLVIPTFEKKDLARMVRQAATSDSALQSFLSEHGDAEVEPNGLCHGPMSVGRKAPGRP